MTQPPGREWRLKTPMPADDLASLSAGDLVYLSGPVFTARDGVYQHMLVEGHEPSVGQRPFRKRLAHLTRVVP